MNPPKLIWRIPSSATEKPIQTIYPLFYKNSVILSQNSSNHSFYLYAVDITEGTIQWIYRDTSLGNYYSSLYYNQKSYQYDNMLLVPVQAQLLSIDLDSGKLLWKNRLHSTAEEYIEGTGHTAFRNYYDYTLNQVFTYKIDLLNGKMDVVKADTFPPASIIIKRSPIPFINDHGDSLLICTSICQNSKTNETRSLLEFYNIKEKKIIHALEVLPLNWEGLGITKQPLYDQKRKRVYLVVYDQIICFDTEKYREVWRTKMDRDMLTSQPSLIDEYLYYPSEDGFLYQINSSKGNINWKSKISGTPGRISHYNSTICVMGGGDERWHIIDKSTGKELYQLKTPNQLNYPGSGFQRMLSIQPHTGIVVCCDDRDIMCFKF